MPFQTPAGARVLIEAIEPQFRLAALAAANPAMARAIEAARINPESLAGWDEESAIEALEWLAGLGDDLSEIAMANIGGALTSHASYLAEYGPSGHWGVKPEGGSVEARDEELRHRLMALDEWQCREEIARLTLQRTIAERDLSTLIRVVVERNLPWRELHLHDFHGVGVPRPSTRFDVDSLFRAALGDWEGPLTATAVDMSLALWTIRLTDLLPMRWGPRWDRVTDEASAHIAMACQEIPTLLQEPGGREDHAGWLDVRAVALGVVTGVIGTDEALATAELCGSDYSGRATIAGMATDAAQASELIGNIGLDEYICAQPLARLVQVVPGLDPELLKSLLERLGLEEVVNWASGMAANPYDRAIAIAVTEGLDGVVLQVLLRIIDRREPTPELEDFADVLWEHAIGLTDAVLSNTTVNGWFTRWFAARIVTELAGRDWDLFFSEARERDITAAVLCKLTRSLARAS